MTVDNEVVLAQRTPPEPCVGAYSRVRALTRGLALLSAINRRPATAAELAAETGINRSTVYRHLETLREAGYVVWDESRDVYRVTTQALHLSAGVGAFPLIVDVGIPILRRFTSVHGWPANLVTYDSGSMVVLASSYPAPARLPYVNITGMRFSMRTSIGRTYLAHLQPAAAARVIDELAASTDPTDGWARDVDLVTRALQQVRVQGYALQIEEAPPPLRAPPLISLAVPVASEFGSLTCINTVMTDEVPRDEVLGRTLHALRSAAHELATVAGTTSSSSSPTDAAGARGS